MSENNVALNNGQQAIINTDRSKVFIWNNRYNKRPYTNSGYTPLTLKEGTVMGIIASVQQWVPCKSTASDGSQIPRGVLGHDITVDAGDVKDVDVCISGDVVEGKLIFSNGTDTLTTLVSSVSMRDHLMATAAGIHLVKSIDHTDYDNQ